MGLDSLKRPEGSVKKRKRVGRGVGSGKGRTAGKGTKGGQARKGYKKKPGFEGGQMPYARRIPKRGFSSTNPDYQIVNIGNLNQFEPNSIVNQETLYKMKLIRKKNQEVKLLAKGELNIPLVVKVDALSEKAKEKILAIGGKIE
ncbi:50S ribosomal protein L15 [bacterium]|nr:50S ribosomal protein L15 [bacterium]MBU1599757.1 50S ribosomal protein L15 [bacterium]MBU2462299.1 50S ribosomal protein L15 [bacterium]